MAESSLPVADLSQESFAPFGDVIETRGREHYPVNDGTSQRFNDLAEIDVAEQGGRPLLSIFRARPFEFPISIGLMERHPLSSQAFVPLHKDPFLIVVAPAGDAIANGDLRAFVSNGNQGVNYRRGVWHHPLIALRRASDFLVIDRGGGGDNCDVFRLQTPVVVQGLP